MPKARREPGIVVRIAQAQDGLMNPLTEAPYNSTMAPSGVLLLLLILFAASGCAALIYELVWFQLLQLMIGSSAISLGILLATYMGGLCLGSLAFSRIVSTERHPFRVYASIEAAIGVLSILVLVCIPYLDGIYVRGATPGAISIALRAVISGVCLLPPTFLMGASLPAMARWLKTTPEGISWLGLFYGANIAGAVLGDLLAGFYLLRLYDVVFANFIAVAINVLSALIAVAMSTWIQYSRDVSSAEAEGLLPQNRNWTAVHVAIALSGLCALGAEVIWTRLLSLMLGATAYTFSIILAIFLVGLGAGSNAGSFIVRQVKRPVITLAFSQLLLAVAISWTAYVLANAMPYWPVDPWISTSPWFIFEIDLLRCFACIFPATFLWGFCFPVALAAVASPGMDSGRIAGEIYGANTIGALIGAMLFSLVLIPALGTQQSQRVLIAISATTAVLLFVAMGSWFRRKMAVLLPAVTALAIVSMWSVSEIPWQVIAFGHRIAPTLRAFQLYDSGAAVSTRVLYKGEGMDTAIVIGESETGQRTYYVNGKSQASNAPFDMRLQRMLGHIPALVHPSPRSVLTIGFGAGVTAGSFVVHPEVQRIVICEIERLVPPAATKYFSRENHDVLHDPRTQIVYDDARHYVMTTRDKFDVITSDPLDPWIKGTAPLYTSEFFESVKQHLSPGGLFALFVQLYESSEEAVQSEIATFTSVFPNTTVWSNHVNSAGYDLVLLGQNEKTIINVDEMQERLNRADYQRAGESMREVGFRSAVELLATYSGRSTDLSPWLRKAQINRDLNLRLQYIAGMGLNTPDSALIYNDMIKYRRFPEDLFAGSSTRLIALRSVLTSPPSH